jgi:hypothetical protein
VLLTVAGGHAAGRFVVGGRTFALRPLAGGAHLLYEVDEAALPEHPDDAVPVAAPRGVVAPSALPEAGGLTFDVLVVYSTTVAAQLGAGAEAYMQGAADLFAEVLANAGPHTARLVYQGPVNYTESGFYSTDLSRLRGRTDGYMDEVHALREQHGADFVALITDDDSVCGVAYLMDPIDPGFEDSAFSISTVDCAIDNVTFPHEIGHNMGARHDRYVDGSNTPSPYSHGLAGPSAVPAERFRTALAYNDACADQGYTCPRIPYYSDPDDRYAGRPIGDAALADNARHVDDAAPTVAAFRPTAVQPLALSVTPSDPPVVVPRGGTVAFTATLTVPSGSPTSFDYWAEATLPGGAVRRVLGPGTVEVTPGTLTRAFAAPVPNSAPLGGYTYTLKVGTYPGPVLASDGFDLTVTAAEPLAEAGDAGWVLEGGPIDFTPTAEELAASAAVAPPTLTAYPNPAPDRATVRFTLGSAATVRLAVYDVLGREVAVLADGEVEPGTHEAGFDGSALASGLYLVRLEADTVVQTQRLTLLR